MIHNSENKFVTITLYETTQRYRKDVVYSTGMIVYNDGVYYEYINISAKSGASITDATYWEAKNSKPLYDCTDVVGMIITLYYKGSRNIIEKYSINADAAFKTIDVSGAANSQYTIELTEELTLAKKEGVLLAEVKMKETSAGAESGFLTTIISDIVISEINTPITEFIEIP